MQAYPHTYVASAVAESAGIVTVAAPTLRSLETAAPPQFGGPEQLWSPEALLCASIADCFVLTFRAVARAARCDWLRLECRVEGVLERAGQVVQFTRYTTFATLTVPTGVDTTKAHKLLERAEHGCLVANSLRGERLLEARVLSAEPAVGAASSLVA
jgi:organic hydroperoxide reductase OsmC/OhrA